MPLAPAFADLVKAAIVRRYADRGLGPGPQMVFLRAARYVYGALPLPARRDPTLISRGHFVAAEAAVLQREAPSSAYRIAVRLDEFAKILDRRGLKAFPVAFTEAYGCLGTLALNLALHAFLNNTELFDAFAIEGAVFVKFGARLPQKHVSRIGLAFLGLSAVFLLSCAATLAPMRTLCSSLTLGFAVWIGSAVSSRRYIPQDVRAACSVTTHFVVLAGITRIVLDVTGGPAWNSSMPSVSLFALSIVWALFAASLFGLSIVRRDKVLRWEGLVLFAAAIVKVFAIDLASLDAVYRILAFIGTGIVLFISSAWYMRSTRTPPIKGSVS